MVKLIIALVLALVALISLSLKKTYGSISPKELKRRAQAEDKTASKLYGAVAYGQSLNLLLWLIIAISAPAFIVLMSRSMPAWVAMAGSSAFVLLGFAWLPSSRGSIISRVIAQIFTPPLAWLLRKLEPPLNRLSLFIRRHRRLSTHTGIYEKEDLLELFNAQRVQPGSRLSKEDLRIAAGALKFSDKTIGRAMIPRRKVKMVNINDSVGPILMSELHKSGHSRFPVFADKQDNIVGIIYLHDLLDVQDGRKVKELMKKQVYYVNQELPLAHALQAVHKTKHHLFVVVNNFEEVVGVITIDDILGQIVGQPAEDEFDKYEDPRAVANLSAKEAEPRRDAEAATTGEQEKASENATKK